MAGTTKMAPTTPRPIGLAAKSNKDLIPIYTDWANHYLDKQQKRRLIQDLQKDMQDSTLLLDVIEAVTGEKVPDVKTKPKNVNDTLDNINACLRFAESLGASLEGINAKDIKDGQLKAILGLFFSLSRFKQHQKQQGQQQNGRPPPGLTSVTGPPGSSPAVGASSAIPLPQSTPTPSNSTAAATTQAAKMSRLPAPYNKGSPSGSPAIASGIPSFTKSPSRLIQPASASTSPAQTTATADTVSSSKTKEDRRPSGSSLAYSGRSPSTTNIPGGGTPTRNTNAVTNHSSTHSTPTRAAAASSGLRPPASSRLQAPSSLRGSSNSLAAQNQQHAAATNSKMLEKFKLFGAKSKTSTALASSAATPPASPRTSSSAATTSKASGGVALRTSTTSSSGFSSARSDASEAAREVNQDIKSKGLAGTRRNAGLKSVSKAAASPVLGRKKSETPEPEKMSNSGNATPTGSLLRRRAGGASDQSLSSTATATHVKTSSTSSSVMNKTSSPPGSSRASKGSSSGADDADSAYAGSTCCTTGGDYDTATSAATSPTTSTQSGCGGGGSGAVSSSASSIGPRRSPVGAASPAPPPSQMRAPSGVTAKPTMAVKGITSPVTSMPKAGGKPTGMPKPGSLSRPPKKPDVCQPPVVGTGLTTPQQVTVAHCTTKTSSGGGGSGGSAAVVGIVSPIMQHKQTPASREREAANAAAALGVGGGSGGHQSDSNSSHASHGSRGVDTDSDSMSVIYCPTAANGVSKPQTAAAASRKRTPAEANAIGTTTSGILVGSTTSITDVTSSSQLSGGGGHQPRKQSRQSSSSNNAEKMAAEAGDGRMETTFDCCAGVVVTARTGGGGEGSPLEVDDDEFSTPVKPMDPLVPRASPYASFRKQPTAEKHHQVPSTQKPHLTFSRQIGSILNAATAAGASSVSSVASTTEADCSAIRCAAGEIAGYVSDSDALTAALQGPLADLTSADLTAGYMSEGGISLYARKMQARFREGLAAAVRDTNRHGGGKHGATTAGGDPMNDSFEDSSSISSGLSENIDDLSTDDLTGSSLSDAQHGPSSRRLYQHQQRTAAAPSSGNTAAAAQQLMHQHQQRLRAAQQQQQQHHLQQQQHQLSQQHSDASLQQRKTAEQESIDQLLQKCRTSSRGLGVSSPGGGGHYSSNGGGAGQRPKSGTSASMLSTAAPNGGVMRNASSGALSARQSGSPAGHHRIQLSADGDVLRVNSSNVSSPGRVPMLNLRKTDGTPMVSEEEMIRMQQQQQGTGSLHRPGSAQAGPYQSSPGGYNGYHSLDRKRHLIGYFSENEGAAAYLDQYHQQSMQYHSQQQTLTPHERATLAMISPRHVAGGNGALSLPVSHEGPLLNEHGWQGGAQHGLSMNGGGGADSRRNCGAGASMVGNHTGSNRKFCQSTTSAVMSRSMIHSSQELKLSGAADSSAPPYHQQTHTSPPGDLHPSESRATNMAVTTKGGRSNGHGLPPCNSPSYFDRRRPTPQNATTTTSGGASPYHQPQQRQSPRLSLHNAALHGDSSPYRQTNGYGRKQEGIYANLIQRTSTPGVNDECFDPTGQQSVSYSGQKLDTSPTALSAPPTAGRSISVGNTGGPHGHHSPYMANVLSRVGVVDGAPASDGDYHHPHQQQHHNGREGGGSSLSLISNNSSVYSSAEEKYQAEIRKLHREVEAYREKVQTLTAQQSTYTSMVHAFEKALQGMVRRVEQLQITSQQKESEVSALRQKIQLLKELSTDMGLNVDAVFVGDNSSAAAALLQRRHTFTQQEQQDSANKANGGGDLLQRQPSVESVVSTTSQRSTVSTSSKGSKTDDKTSLSSSKGAKRSWIRSSFSKAFTKSKNGKAKTSTTEAGATADFQRANSADKTTGQPPASARGSGENGRYRLNEVDEEHEVVDKLKVELAKKDTTLTDVRLEALTSLHQVDKLKEALSRLKFENASLKQDNDRLQHIMSATGGGSPPRTGSQTSLPTTVAGDDDDALSSVASDHNCHRNSLDDSRDSGRVRATVAVSFDVTSDVNGSQDGVSGRTLIGSIYLTADTNWQQIDAHLGHLLNEYLHKIDPASNLNLSNVDSLLGYRIGSTTRHLIDNSSFDGGGTPPIRCLAVTEGSPTIPAITVYLRAVNQDAVDALAFETLIPRAYLERLVYLLLNSRRLILSGGVGTGKTYLADKLAGYVVAKPAGGGRTATDAATVVSRVCLEEGGGAGEMLKRFLDDVTKRWKHTGNPLVVIIDNLHYVSSITDAFSALSSMKDPVEGPYILVTTNQNPSTNHLQIQHNFKLNQWVNSRDPIKYFLGRYLMRRCIDEECRRGASSPGGGRGPGPGQQELMRVLEFLPKVWLQLNKFLETANSLDVSIGPRVFLACPLDVHKSRSWFVALWNEQVVPYLVQAAREGLAMYGRRGSLEDPTDFVCSEWPWQTGEMPDVLLAKLSPEDISLDAPTPHHSGANKPDPLMMLVRLQQQQQMRLSSED